MTLADRIKVAAKIKGVSQAGLARACGISRPSVNAWFNGSTQSIDGKYLTTAAECLGVDAHWLATGEGHMIRSANLTNKTIDFENAVSLNPSNVEAAPDLVQSRRVPVVGEVKGGLDGYFEALMYPVGHGEGYVEYWCKDEHAYALRVRGDSMHPRYRAGEFVVVTPSYEPTCGSDVVVQLVDGRKLLKELNWIRGDDVQLLSINGSYEPMTVSKADILSMQSVAGGVPRHAFISH